MEATSHHDNPSQAPHGAVAGQSSALFDDAPQILSWLKRAAITARRDGRSLGILLFDLSGGDFADPALENMSRTERSRRFRRLGMAVSTALAHDNICGRTSPTELLAILPGADERAAMEAATRVVRSTIGRQSSATLSHCYAIAPAALSAEDSTVEAFLGRARASMVDPTEFLPQDICEI